MRDGTKIRRQWKERTETEKGKAKKKINEEKIWNLTVGVHDMSEIRGVSEKYPTCVGAILRHPDRGILRSSPHLIEPHAPSGISTS